jgi:hypothetical protein
LTAAFAQPITKFIGQDNRTDCGSSIQLAFSYSSFGTDYSDLGDVAYLRYFLKSRARSRFSYISKTKSPAWMLMTSGSAIIGIYLNEWTI